MAVIVADLLPVSLRLCTDVVNMLVAMVLKGHLVNVRVPY